MKVTNQYEESEVRFTVRWTVLWQRVGCGVLPTERKAK
jgi:hypothetical protein